MSDHRNECLGTVKGGNFTL